MKFWLNPFRKLSFALLARQPKCDRFRKHPNMKNLIPCLAVAVATSMTAFAGAGSGPWANGAYFPGQLDGRYSANVYNNTQARFDSGQMQEPSGNSVRTDTFTTIPGSTTVSNVLSTNSTTTVTISNFGGLLVTNVVVTTNISSTQVTNSTPTLTNLTSSGAAAVVSGVLGFAIRNGTPSTSLGGGAASIGSGSSTVSSISLDTSHNYFVIYVDGDVFAGQTAAGINLNTQKVAGSLWSGVGRGTFERVENPVYVTNTNTGSISFVGYRTEILSIPGATAGGYFNGKIKDNKSPFVFRGAGEISTRGTPQANSAGLNASATYPFNLDGIKSSDNSISGYSLSGRNAP